MFANLVYTVVDLLGETFPEISSNPGRIIDIINEEEQQFLKTLSRGRNLLNKTITKLGGNDTKVIPGSVAWQLYDTYGFPVDLTSLMAEEKGLTIDMEGYEAAKERAYIMSQGKEANKDLEITLDVHALSDLQARNIPSTDDSFKYAYGRAEDGEVLGYNFNRGRGKILAIRSGNEFVDKATEGMSVGVVLDKSYFYAEAGGQIFDQGMLYVCTGTDESDEGLAVEKVANFGGYILHVGKVQGEGEIKVGDEVSQMIDVMRRRLTMNNHSATHTMNHALLRVLGTEINQKGSLVLPDRLRFDFNYDHGLTVDQIQHIEDIVNKMSQDKLQVFVEETPLADAKKIDGLRSVFDEVYPDPVRVISFGVPVQELLKAPKGGAGTTTSVEFCGGTHLHNAGDMGSFVITTEESIARGIRRIVALTGPAAEKAIEHARYFEQTLTDLKAQAGQENSSIAAIQKKIVVVQDAVAHSQIPYVKKHELRSGLTALAKQLMDKKKQAQKQTIAAITSDLTELNAQLNEETKYIVKNLYSGDIEINIAKDILSKEPKASSALPRMYLTVDTDTKKVNCMALVPEKNGPLKANEWITHVAAELGGRAGGTGDRAQGVLLGELAAIVEAADAFAKLKLN